MAGRTHFYTEVFAERRSRRELVAATTGYFDVAIAGMDVGFHGMLSRALEGGKGRVGYSEVRTAASPERLQLFIHRSCG